MKVFVSRMGGVTGMQLTWQVRVDDQPDADIWWELLDSLPWDDAPDARVQPDRFCYKISVEPHQVTIPEERLEGPWRELVDRVRSTQHASD